MTKRIRPLVLDHARPVESSPGWTTPVLVYLLDPTEPDRSLVLGLSAADAAIVGAALVKAAREAAWPELPNT